MPVYVDGFVLPVPKKNLDAYPRMSQKAGGSGVIMARSNTANASETTSASKGVTSFLRLVKSKPGETVVFAWIVYKSRAHRDRVNAKVMKDPRLAKMDPLKSMPFDSRRMAYGGFKVC